MLGYRNRSGLALPYMNNSFQSLHQSLLNLRLSSKVYIYNILFEDYREKFEEILYRYLTTFRDSKSILLLRLTGQARPVTVSITTR